MKKCRLKVPKILSLVCVLLMMVGLLVACGDPGPQIKSRYDLNVIDHTSDFYVNDFAGVFTEEQKAALMEKAVAFDSEYSGIQVVITTVEYLNDAVVDYEYAVRDEDGNLIEDANQNPPSEEPKFTIEEIGYSMYKEYGIGQDDMGILILFSTGDREVRIETGRQMQFYITDSLSGRLLDDYGMEDFSNDRFAEGLIAVQSGTIDEIKKHVSADWYTVSQTEKEETVGGNVSDDTNRPAGVDEAEPNGKESGGGILWGLFGSIGAAGAAIVAFFTQNSKRKKEKEALEKAKDEEIASLRQNFQNSMDEKDRECSFAIETERRKHKSIVDEKDRTISNLEGRLSKSQQEAAKLSGELEVLTDKFDRVKRLYPDHDFEQEVVDMIEGEYKDSARQIDNEISPILSITATKDNASVFYDAISMYDAADENVRKHITTDKSKLQFLYGEAIRLKEEYEREQQEIRDKAAAKDAYTKIESVMSKNLYGNHDTFKALNSAIAIFAGLTAAQKAFFPDQKLMSSLRSRHSEAERDYNDYTAAKNAESSVESVIGYMGSADEDDRDKLNRAMRYYNNLSQSEKAYFSKEILAKLKRLISQAEEDHRRQERRRAEEKRRREAEEAERRRRQAAAAAAARRSSSSSSFRSSSSFSGRGGRPGGGGASRKF